MFGLYLKSVKLSNDIDWEYLVKNSAGYSGADISNVILDVIVVEFYMFERFAETRL